MMTYKDVLGVGDGSNDSCSDHELFPSLGEVDNVDSLLVALVNVGLHQVSAVLSAKVGLNRKIRDEGTPLLQQQS